MFLISFFHKRKVLVYLILILFSLSCYAERISHAFYKVPTYLKAPRAMIYSSIKDKTFITKLVVSLQRWKLYFWNKLAEKDNAVGGGITHPHFTVGTYSKYGEYRIFEDNSLLYSWSSLLYHKSLWTIKEPSYITPFGIQSAYKLLSVWVSVSNISKNPKSYELGVTIGKKLYNIYEPVLLYQYTYRLKLPVYTKAWNSWYLNRPPSLSLHSIALAQKIYLGKYFFARISIEMSSSDILQHAVGGSGLFKIISRWFLLSMFIYASEPHFITKDWKYHKNIWTHSASVRIMYSKYSYFRIRYSVNQENPFSQYKLYDSKSKKAEQIKQLYEVFWSYIINVQKNYSHTIGVLYKFENKKTRHSNTISYFLFHKEWSLYSTITTYLFYNKENYFVEKSDMSLKVKITKKNVIHMFRIYGILSLQLHMYKNQDFIYDIKYIFKHISFTVGIYFKIGNSSYTIAMPFVYSRRIGFESSFELTVKYFL